MGFISEKIRKGYKGSPLRNVALAMRAEREKSRPAKEVSFSDVWQPNPGPQAQFFHSTCREILFGGAAGGGKSSALTAMLLRYSHLPGCNMVVFRRESTQFKDLIDKSKGLFPKAYPGLDPIHSPHFVWNFPSGATANYRHLQHEKSAAAYDGWEINLLCFDELTHFLEKQYLALCARVRSANPNYPTYIRATTNPGGEGHDWVFRRWGAWLDPEFEAAGLPTRLDDEGNRLPPAKPCEIWWVRTDEKGVEEYFDHDPAGTPNHDPLNPALSRTFIPSLLSDNPHLAQNDPNYVAALNSLDPVRRAQLKFGDWLAKPAAGRYFKRSWVEFVDSAPTEGVLARVRYWDFAATEKKSGKSDPDFTVGVKQSHTADSVYIEHVTRGQWDPAEVERQLRATAEEDGKAVPIGIPQDPGQAGKAQVMHLMLLLRGWIVRSRVQSGDKVARFSPFSGFADPENNGGVKRVKIVRGPWNNAYLDELEAFPSPGIHDDQVDPTGEGFSVLSEAIAKRRNQNSTTEVINTSDRT